MHYDETLENNPGGDSPNTFILTILKMVHVSMRFESKESEQRTLLDIVRSQYMPLNIRETHFV